MTARKSPYKPFGIFRFVLALMVLTQHFCDDLAPQAIKQMVFPWAPGNVAVLGFFVISGFIICEAYHFNYRDRPVAYIKNRFLRILPGYWAALFISILIHFFLLHFGGHLISMERSPIGDVYFDAHNIIKNIAAIIPPVRVNVTETEYPFIPYAWALQTEMMFYLTVFIVGYFYQHIRKYSKLPQGFWLSIAAYIAIIVAFCAQMDWVPDRLSYGSYFAFGGALFFAMAGYQKALFVLVPALLQMIGHFQTYAEGDFDVIAANRPGQFLLLALIIATIVGLATRKTKPIKVDQIMGDLSYPLYLNHYIVAIFILNMAGTVTIGYLVDGLVASLVLARLMYVLVERPVIKWRKAIREAA